MDSEKTLNEIYTNNLLNKIHTNFLNDQFQLEELNKVLQPLRPINQIFIHEFISYNLQYKIYREIIIDEVVYVVNHSSKYDIKIEFNIKPIENFNLEVFKNTVGDASVTRTLVVEINNNWEYKELELKKIYESDRELQYNDIATFRFTPSDILEGASKHLEQINSHLLIGLGGRL